MLQVTARHKAGAVPRYLRSRQAEWAEAEAAARAAVPDPDCPPGHVRLPDTEVAARLAGIQVRILPQINNSLDALKLSKVLKVFCLAGAEFAPARVVPAAGVERHEAGGGAAEGAGGGTRQSGAAAAPVQQAEGVRAQSHAGVLALSDNFKYRLDNFL